MIQCKIKWKKKKLENLSEMQKGKLTAQRPFRHGNYIKLLNTETLFSRIEMYADPKNAVVSTDKDILILCDGERSGLVTKGQYGVVGSTFAKLSINNSEIDSSYLYHFMNNKFIWIQNRRTGTGVPHIPKDLSHILEIEYPKDTEEQQRIANILSTCDEVIEKTEETIDKYKQIKAGMMQDLFTRGLDKNGKLRPTYVEAPYLYKYSEELDRYIPKEWDVKTFNKFIEENIIDSIQDGNHGERHPKTSDFVATGIPFIMANNITKDGHVDLKNCNFITYEQYKSLRIGFATENDVLLTHKGTIGLTAIIPIGVKDVMLTPQVTCYRIKDSSRLDKYYLYTYFQSPMFQNIIQGLSEQSTRAYIGITKQAELDCIHTNIAEQRNIGKVVNEINDKLKFEQELLSKYKQIKQGLMKKLLTPPPDAEIVEE